MTIVALAQEAGVPRNALTQRHLDLKNDFYAKVRDRGKIPDSEARLRRQIVKLKELRAKDAEELKGLRADVQALVQSVNQLTLEKQQLRTEPTTPTSSLRLLSAHPQP
ncbi:hypothetical protein [Streptomyces sp. NRRL B-24484]|uniref:hypothetical protein n=1 Tax=Streptomyces sp. NRRL B-24484 TaxID=1463833 RepID=UPI000A5F69CF|nr:hypothetical protein [Streptomyces sp. NRRL B-24484]